jgi:hypothetical protein
MGDKKPDNYVENPGIMPYGTDLGAPSIRPENIENWKNSKIIKVNKEFSNRYEFLKKQYDDLIEEFKWNDIIYGSKFNFEPVVGETYYLYYGQNGKKFLSLIEPNQWNKEHIGTFTLNFDNKWIKI